MDQPDVPSKSPNDAPEGLTDTEAAFLREFGGLEDSAFAAPDAYDRIVAETAAREAKEYLTTKQLAERLGIDTSEVRQWAGANGLTAHRLGAKLTFPAWQLMDGADGSVVPLPHLTEVGWGIQGDLRHATWIMTTVQPELRVDGVPVTPAQWLASGRDVEPVVSILGENVLW